ncbi:MAG: 3-oxoacyl-ACP synthase, partial [Chloroflexota bacterium]
MNMYAHITGWGTALPEKILTNDEISKIVDTTDQWIRERTGIRQRYIAGENDSTASLGAEAAINALKAANLAPT